MQFLPDAIDEGGNGQEPGRLLNLNKFELSDLLCSSSWFPGEGTLVWQGPGDADLELYARASFWAPYEIAALSLGKNPNMMAHQDIADPHLLSSYPICKEYIQRLHLINRAVRAGQLWAETIPNGALAWLERMRISYPASLKDQIERLGLQVADWKTVCDRLSNRVRYLAETFEVASKQYNDDLAAWQADAENHARWQYEACCLFEEQGEVIANYQTDIEALSQQLAAHDEAAAVKPDIGKRERNSLLIMIRAMSIKGYSYDPSENKSKTPSEIADDIAETGDTLSVETIRKYLQEASPRHTKSNAN